MSWKEKENALVREFKFRNFVEAFSFLAKVALIAEKMNHHPQILNSYNKVTLTLSTHDAGDIITQKDHELSKKIDALLEN